MTCRIPIRAERKNEIMAAESLLNNASDQSIALLVLPLIEHSCLNDTMDHQAIEALCKCVLSPSALPAIASICLLKQHLSHARHYIGQSNIILTTPINFPNGECDTKYIKHETQHAIAAGANEVELYIPRILWNNFSVIGDAMDAFLEQCDRYQISSKLALDVNAHTERLELHRIIKGAFSLGFGSIKIMLGAKANDIDLESLLEETNKSSINNRGICFYGHHLDFTDATLCLAAAMREGMPLAAKYLRFSSTNLLVDTHAVLAAEMLPFIKQNKNSR